MDTLLKIDDKPEIVKMNGGRQGMIAQKTEDALSRYGGSSTPQGKVTEGSQAARKMAEGHISLAEAIKKAAAGQGMQQEAGKTSVHQELATGHEAVAYVYNAAAAALERGDRLSFRLLSDTAFSRGEALMAVSTTAAKTQDAKTV